MCNYINFVRGKRIVYGCLKIFLLWFVVFFIYFYNFFMVLVWWEIVFKVVDLVYIWFFVINIWKYLYVLKIVWWLYNWDVLFLIKRICIRSKRIRGFFNIRLWEVGGGIINKCYVFKFIDWGCRVYDFMYVRKFGWLNILICCGGFCSNGMEGMMWVMMKFDNFFIYLIFGEKENKVWVILIRNFDELWIEMIC